MNYMDMNRVLNTAQVIPRLGERALHRPRLAFLGYLLRLASLAWLWFVDLFLGLDSMQWTVVFTDFTLSCVWPGFAFLWTRFREFSRT